MGELKGYGFPEEKGTGEGFLKNPLLDLPAPRMRFQTLFHKATAGVPQEVAGPPSTGAPDGTTPNRLQPRCCRRSRTWRPEGAAVSIRPSSPAAHGVQSPKGSPAVHATKRAAGDLRPRGHGGAAPGSAARGARSARSLHQSRRHRNAVTAMHGGSPASCRAQELRNK